MKTEKELRKKLRDIKQERNYIILDNAKSDFEKISLAEKRDCFLAQIKLLEWILE